MSDPAKAAGAVVASMLHDLVAGSALHCLEVGAPGIAPDLRRALANSIARRAVYTFAGMSVKPAPIANGPTCHPGAFWAHSSDGTANGAGYGVCSICGKRAT